MNTKKLNYIVKWDKDKTRTWSGTPAGILQGLSEIGIEFNEVDLGYTEFQKIFHKLICGLCKIVSKRDFDLYSLYIQGKVLRKKIKNRKIETLPSIMFWTLNSSLNEDAYVYQDLSVNYIASMYYDRHELLKYTPLSPNVPEKLVKIRQKNEMKFYKSCRGIFTMSNWLAEDIVVTLGINPQKVHSVGGGCNIDANLIDTSKKQGNKFLFVGIDFFRKGGDLVVSAFELIRKNNLNAELYIAGPKEWPMKGNVPDGVVFLGQLGKEELSKYYNICDVFVMPSHFEAYGLVFGEALIHGLPCVTRNAYAMKEFIIDEENGYLIDNDDVEYLSEIMNKALNNKVMREKVIADRDYYVNKYSWKTVAQRIADVIENDYR